MAGSPDWGSRRSDKSSIPPDIADDLSYTRGRHTIKTGFQYVRLRVRLEVQRQQRSERTVVAVVLPVGPDPHVLEAGFDGVPAARVAEIIRKLALGGMEDLCNLLLPQSGEPAIDAGNRDIQKSLSSDRIAVRIPTALPTCPSAALGIRV